MTHLRMMGSLTVLGIAAVVMLGLVTGADEKGRVTPSAEPETPESQSADKHLSHFMRLKLEASGQVLEGLAVEDFDLIKKGAKKLNEMSTAEQWRVTNDAMYRNFSGDFQRVTKDLVKSADDENLDRAALKWMAATMSCIECHRYVRGIMIASIGPTTEVQP